MSEGQLEQALAVVTMLSEVCGFVSPSLLSVVNKVKMAVIKENNEGKRDDQENHEEDY